MAMVAQSQPFSYHCSVNFPCPHKKEHGEKRGHRRPEYDQPRRHRLREEAMAKLDADQKLYDAYSQRKPTERPHLLHRVPVLQIGVVFADGWYRNQPPKDQSVDNQGIPGRNPEAELKKECVKFDGHENYAQA